MSNYNTEYKRWLACEALTKEEQNELFSIEHDEEAKALRFSLPMDFGTAGLRSAMYMGIGCMNRFTVAHTTRGIAALVKEAGGERRGVAIAYDSRNNSDLFARVSASVLASEGVRVYIFDGIRPTPELSFAVRELSAMAGINITASHNPKEYNGYKAYWEDGAQISPEQAKIVSSARDKFDVLDASGIFDFEKYVDAGMITVLGSDFDEKYINAVLKTAICPDVIKNVSEELRVVYTPLHGAGYKLVPEVFSRRGLKHLYTVSEQMIPDGNFPTVKKPNPEYRDVFELGMAIANNVNSDLVIATDPDSDRVGVVTRNKDGVFVTISGNQMGALLLDYVITQKKKMGTLSSGAYCVKSIVSTDMAYKIAEVNGVKLHDVLTGFKFIGEVIKNYEKMGVEDAFLLGFEESYGYLFGSYARDKDAVGASMIILEMTAYYKSLGMTLSDALTALYKKYGFYAERMIDTYMEGLDGIEKRRKVMDNLRKNPPKDFAGVSVISIGDFSASKVLNVKTGEYNSISQPKSDVLYFTLENGDKIIVRPSGTEPKIKTYILLHSDDEKELKIKAESYEKDSKKLMEV
jgi:phosphoglucomutase